MKRVIQSVLLVFSLAVMGTVAKAQVSVNVNVGIPPVWAPVGYTDVRYYYIPDIETYYDNKSRLFYYYGPSGAWVSGPSLPPAYRSYDLQQGNKIVIQNYYGPRPYAYFTTHKAKFPKGYKGDIVYKHGGGGPPAHVKRGGHPGKGHGNSPGKGHGKDHGKNK